MSIDSKSMIDSKSDSKTSIYQSANTSKTIAVLAPASYYKEESFQNGCTWLTSLGYTLLYAPHHQARYLYNSGTVKQRVSDLLWALNHPEVDLIWCIRGGYGSVELLPYLEQLDINKPILGFSDITALFSYLWNQKNLNGFHAPVLTSIHYSDEQSLNYLKTWLSHGTLPKLSALHLLGSKTICTAPIVGGNLCILASLCGSIYQLKPHGCILALEDINEPAYKIDRMLLQLELSGVFDHIEGILLGEFYQCSVVKEADWTLIDVFIKRLAHLNVPVYYQAPFGHHKQNWIWQQGQIITLETLS
jgi:muramoyltetrapeptide carboxypeptidase